MHDVMEEAPPEMLNWEVARHRDHASPVDGPGPVMMKVDQPERRHAGQSE